MALKAGRAGIRNDLVDEFGNISSGATEGYTKAEADARFLNKVDAATEYLTQSGAASTYETQTNAAATYETQTHAANTYETQSSAAATYETQSHAAATYETQAAASTAYSNLSSAIPSYTEAVTQNNGVAVFDNLNPNYGYDIEFVHTALSSDPVVIPKWTSLKQEAGTNADTIKLTYAVTGTDGTSQYKLFIKK